MLYAHNTVSVRLFCFLATTLALTVGTFGAAGPTTLRDDDSCDISVAPAATLLLPYFEVDLENASGETTLFTMTNVTSLSQIARVTLWTDLAYPVVTFNIYLTGYDVHSLDLRDVLVRGVIGPSLGTGIWVSHVGDRSELNGRLDISLCGVIPPRLDATAVLRMQQAFTLGSITGFCDRVGTSHANAVGYATVDVVGNCGTSGPTDPDYFTEDIRYDNVLIGDYQQVNGHENYAQGSSMVHIRAIPEGGTPRNRAERITRFERTFYGRFQDPAHPVADARQPLPSTFAARWINGSTGDFKTSFQIWRQGVTTVTADCAAYRENEFMFMGETVVFDLDENGEGVDLTICDSLCDRPELILLPATSRVSVTPGSETLPQSILSDDTAGWVYFNFDDATSDNAHQNWVTVSMRAEGRYSVAYDAAWLGNGCSPGMPFSSYSDRALPPPGVVSTPTPPGAILPGPAPDVNPPRP